LRGSSEDQRSRFLACGSEQHAVVFAAPITSQEMMPFADDKYETIVALISLTMTERKIAPTS
jgi:hypothetical protein